MRCLRSVFFPGLIAILSWMSAVRDARADVNAEQVRSSLEKAVAYLKREQKRNGTWTDLSHYPGGITALGTLALLEAGESPDSRTVQRGLQALRSIDTKKVYVVSLQTMVFCRAGKAVDRARIRSMVRWLESVQDRSKSDARGGWGYPGGPSGADNSNSQFALLALHEAEQAGFDVQSRTWQAALGYWRRGQNANGSWGYLNGMPGKGSMTCAGIASMVIALEGQSQGSVQIVQGRCACGDAEEDESLDKAIRWLGRNFSVTRNPDEMLHRTRIDGKSKWHLYYLYGIERVGRMTARRFFSRPASATQPARRYDWYREGADYLLSRQDPGGFWKGENRDAETDPILATSLAVLFLSKGRRPVLISKLQRDGNDWNRVRGDLTHLTRSAERRWKMPMTWQVIDGSHATADDFSQTPVLFLSGSDAFAFSDLQRRELRRYVEQGGFIFADSSCDGEDFERSFRNEMREIFPEAGYELKQLDAQHPIWSIDGRIDPDYVNPDGRWLWGIDFACKTSVVFCPGNLACYWALDTTRKSEGLPKAIQDEVAACRAIGLNVLAYATNRKLKPKDAIPRTLASVRTQSSDLRGHFAIAKLRHAGGCDAAPRAMVNLMDSVSHSLKMRTASQPPLLAITDKRLLDYPFLYMHGRNDFRLSVKEKRQLKTFVERGGTLLADAICASPAFARAFRREIRDVFGQSMTRIPADDALLTSEYGGSNLHDVTRRTAVRERPGGPLVIQERKGLPDLEAITMPDGRHAVIFSPLDLSCALEKHVSPHCRGYTPKDAARIAINVIVYSLHE